MVGAVPHRLDGGVELLEHRDDDHLDEGVVLLDDPEDFEAADPRQADIEQHELDVLLFHDLESRLARGCAEHAVIAPQDRVQRIPHPLVVVDDEDGLPAFGHTRGEYIKVRF